MAGLAPLFHSFLLFAKLEFPQMKGDKFSLCQDEHHTGQQSPDRDVLCDD